MADKRTEKSPYKSLYGGGWVTPAQYITERICAKMSEDDLPNKFWQLPEWKKKFRDQIQAARALLRNGYAPEAIGAALKDKRLYNIKSFRLFNYPVPQRILEEYQKEYEYKQEQLKQNYQEVKGVEGKHSTRVKKSSALDKLRKLDG